MSILFLKTGAISLMAWGHGLKMKLLERFLEPFKKSLDPLKKAYALEIKLKGEVDWDLIWSSTKLCPDRFEKFSKIASEIPNYIGEFIVYKDNTLTRGYIHDNLEKKTAVLDLEESSNIPEILHNGMVHAHFADGSFIRYNKNKILDAEEIEKYLEKTTEMDDKEIINKRVYSQDRD